LGFPRLDADLVRYARRLRLVVHTGASVRFLVSDALFAKGIHITQADAAMARPVAGPNEPISPRACRFPDRSHRRVPDRACLHSDGRRAYLRGEPLHHEITAAALPRLG
jgi:hypothetical protein